MALLELSQTFNSFRIANRGLHTNSMQFVPKNLCAVQTELNQPRRRRCLGHAKIEMLQKSPIYGTIHIIKTHAMHSQCSQVTTKTQRTHDKHQNQTACRYLTTGTGTHKTTLDRS